MRLPSPRRAGATTRLDANNALLKARMSKAEQPEPVGQVITRPHRIERDHRAEISSVDIGIGVLHSMAIASKGSHCVVGGAGELAVVAIATLYAGTPNIVKAKISGGSRGSVKVASSASADTIAAFANDDSKKVHIYSRSLGSRGEITRQGRINCIAVSPDGTRVAVGSREKLVSVYSLSMTGASLLIEYDITPYVFSHSTCLDFSNSGRWLAMGGDMRKSCVWNVSSRDQTPLRVIGRGGVINALDFSPSDKWLAIASSGDQLLSLIDTESWNIEVEVLQAGDAMDCRSVWHARVRPHKRRPCLAKLNRASSCLLVRARPRVALGLSAHAASPTTSSPSAASPPASSR
jgi:WD40 repeat protein